MLIKVCDRCKRKILREEDSDLTLWIGTEKADLCIPCQKMLEKFYYRTKKGEDIKPIEVPEINGGFIFG